MSDVDPKRLRELADVTDAEIAALSIRRARSEALRAAADEIERLTEKVADLDTALKESLYDAETFSRPLADIARKLNHLRVDMGICTRDELAALRARAERAEAALRPFAAYAAGLPEVIAGEPRLTDDDGVALRCSPAGVEHTVTFGDLRRAGEAIAARDAPMPDEIYVDGVIDSKGVRYIGTASRQVYGTYRALADVAGCLCIVEYRIVRQVRTEDGKESST